MNRRITQMLLRQSHLGYIIGCTIHMTDGCTMHFQGLPGGELCLSVSRIFDACDIQVWGLVALQIGQMVGATVSPMMHLQVHKDEPDGGWTQNVYAL